MSVIPKTCLLLIMLSLPGLTAQPAFSGTATQAPDHWYLKRDDGHWCSYASKTDWEAASTYQSATARFAENMPQSIHVEGGDESGDWYLIDDYTLDNGRIVRLDRRYNTFSDGGVSLYENYEVKNGVARRASHHMTPLVSEKILPDVPHLDANFPVVVRLRDFDFYGVLMQKPRHGVVCR